MKTCGMFVYSVLVSSQCWAAPVINFSHNLPTGDLHTPTITVGNVQIDAIGGNIFRFDEAQLCCGHKDNGLGVIGRYEDPSRADEPELDKADGNQEWLRLTNNTGLPWVAVWFSSVNFQSQLDIYASPYPSSTHYTVTEQTLGATSGKLNLLPADYDSKYLWITPGGNAKDNYSLVWGVDTKVPTVPEPSSLVLLGTSLLGLVRYLRKS